MREAAANLEFEEAARLRDELKRLQETELLVGADPMARQQSLEDQAGAYAGERKYGRAANLPANRPHRPASDEMGPHNLGGGEAGPAARARKPGLDEMGPGATERPLPRPATAGTKAPDPGVKAWKRRGGRR